MATFHKTKNNDMTPDYLLILLLCLIVELEFRVWSWAASL